MPLPRVGGWLGVFHLEVFTVVCGGQQGTFLLLSYCSLLLTQVLYLFLWK